MIHAIFGFAVIIIAAITLVDPTAFPVFVIGSLLLNIVGGITSIYIGFSRGD